MNSWKQAVLKCTYIFGDRRYNSDTVYVVRVIMLKHRHTCTLCYAGYAVKTLYLPAEHED